MLKSKVCLHYWLVVQVAFALLLSEWVPMVREITILTLVVYALHHLKESDCVEIVRVN